MKFNNWFACACLFAIALAYAMPVSGQSVPTVEFKDQNDFLGVYECSGVGVNNEKYSLTLIIDKEWDNFHLLWVEGKKMLHVGIGIQTGNTLSISFLKIIEKNGETTFVPSGVGAYAIEDNVLNGKWAHGTGKIYSEACYKKKTIAAK